MWPLDSKLGPIVSVCQEGSKCNDINPASIGPSDLPDSSGKIEGTSADRVNDISSKRTLDTTEKAGPLWRKSESVRINSPVDYQS